MGGSKGTATMRSVRTVLILAMIAGGTLLTVPPAAPAAGVAARCTDSWCLTTARDVPGYAGWHATIRGGCAPPDAGPMAVCSSASPTNYPRRSWRWIGGRWNADLLAPGTEGYVAPFGSGWSWFYVRGSGWHAVEAWDVRVWVPRHRLSGLHYVDCAGMMDPAFGGVRCGWNFTRLI